MGTRIILIVTIILISFSFIQSQDDKSKDVEEIKAIIKKQAESFYNNNFEDLMELWAHEPYVIRMGSKGDKHIGWESVQSSYKNYLENNPIEQERKLDLSDFQVKIHDNVAWVVNNQKTERSSRLGSKATESWQVRVLEKKNGEWKIVYFINGLIEK